MKKCGYWAMVPSILGCAVLDGNKVNIKYFLDTDAELVEFSNNLKQETKEISESIYLYLDAKGSLVSLTIEYASFTAHLPNISYQQIEKKRVSA